MEMELYGCRICHLSSYFMALHWTQSFSIFFIYLSIFASIFFLLVITHVLDHEDFKKLGAYVDIVVIMYNKTLKLLGGMCYSLFCVHIERTILCHICFMTVTEHYCDSE